MFDCKDPYWLSPLRPFLSVVGFTSDFFGLKMSVENLSAVNHELRASSCSNQTREALLRDQRLYAFNFMKSALAILLVILGLALTATGIGAIQGIILLTLGLSKTCFSIAGKIYKEQIGETIDLYGPGSRNIAQIV